MTVEPAFPVSFASDNHAGAHPDVLRALGAANSGFAPAYGGDPQTAKLREVVRQEFGPSALVFPVFNGTGANVVGLGGGLKRYEAVLCAERSHIDADEGGAPERVGGFKLLMVAAPDHKISTSTLLPYLARKGDTHAVQPRMISITQSTEVGTVYSLDELRELSSFARAHGLFLHMDGARIANAAATLGCTLRECTTDVGIDVLSFGATKNGALGAEAVIALSSKFAASFAEDLRFMQKQGMQLASKSRYLSAQLLALFENGLWRKNALHANSLATQLEVGILALAAEGRPVSIVHPVQANAVFARIPIGSVSALQTTFPFYVWDDRDSASGSVVVRWMTSFQTRSEDVRLFLEAIRDSLV